MPPSTASTPLSASISDLAQLQLRSPSALSARSQDSMGDCSVADLEASMDLPSLTDLDTQGSIEISEIKVGKKVGSGYFVCLLSIGSLELMTH